MKNKYMNQTQWSTVTLSSRLVCILSYLVLTTNSVQINKRPPNLINLGLYSEVRANHTGTDEVNSMIAYSGILAEGKSTAEKDKEQKKRKPRPVNEKDEDNAIADYSLSLAAGGNEEESSDVSLSLSNQILSQTNPTDQDALAGDDDD
jgi:hypothetical protein